MFDILARDAASAVFNNVGSAAGNAGQQTAGFTSTLKAAGAALLGGGLITGLKSLYDAAAESAKVTALTEQVIKSTGGAANLTAQQVGDLASAISAKTGVDDEAIQSGQNLLLTFCLEESAQALARGRGWVSHADLRAGDEILAYDPEDDTARWEPVTSMHRFAVNGDLIRWRSKQIDVATTPHHRWWTVGTSGTSPYTPRFRTTEDISGSQVYVKIGGGEAAGFAGEAVFSDDLVELAGWVMTEGWFVKWRDQSRPLRQRTCARCQQAPARNRAGVAVCNGCAKKPIQAGRTSPRAKVTAETSQATGVGFCQSETANPLEVKRIRLLVERLRMQGHRISETSYAASRNGSSVLEWHFAGDLGATMRTILPNKKLTYEFIEQLTADQGRLLLDVLIAADGHVDRHGHEQFIQKDAGQLDVVAALAAMLGRRSTVLAREDALYFPETNRLKGSAVNAHPEHYEGTVWCPHLRTGIFLARNRGRTFWTGNTNIRNAAGEGNDIFTQTTQIMTDMSVALGTDAAGSAVQLGKALNDPIKGVSALTRVGVSFTSAQKEQIAALVEAGDVMGAQKIILAELGREFGGAAEAAATPWDKLQVTLGNLVEEVGSYLIPVFSGFANFVMDDLIPAVREAVGWLGDNFGGALAAVGGFFSDLVGIGVAVVGFFADLPTPILLGAAALGAWLLLRGPIDAFLTWASVKYVSFATTVVASGGLVAGAATAIKGTLAGLLTALGGPVGLAIAGVTIGLGFLASALMDTDEATEETTAAQNQLTEALKASKGAIDANVRAAAAKELQDQGVLDTLEDMGIATSTATDAILGNEDALGTLGTQLQIAINSGSFWNGTMTDEAIAAQAAKDALYALSGQTEGSIASAGQLAAATAETGTAMATAAGQTALAGEALDEWLKSMQSAVEGFVEPASIYRELQTQMQQAAEERARGEAENLTGSAENWQDYVREVEVSLTEYATALQTQLDNQTNWRTNLVQIAQWAGADVAQYLAEMGQDGVDIVAQMADGTTAGAQDMREQILREIQQGGAEWTAAMGDEMLVMERIGRDGSVATVQQVARELGLGVGQVREIARKYGIELASGINPLLRGLGKPGIDISGAINSGGGLAEGGPVPGPYIGPKADNVLIRANPREFMQPVAAVDFYGRDFMEAVRTRRFPLDAIRGYADGGFISTSDVPKPPSLAPYQWPISTPGQATNDRAYADTAAWVAANAMTMYTGGSTPNGVGGLGPAALRAANFVRSNWGFTGTIGGYSYRNIAGTNQLSKHAFGKAIDVMTYSNQALAQSIADYFAGPGRAAFGVDNVITNRRINSGGGWAPYFGVSPHTDHAHIDFYKTGTDYVPRTGPAILHQGEAVIPAEVNARRGAPLDLSDSTIERLARAMIRGAGSVVAHGNDRQARNVRSAR